MRKNDENSHRFLLGINWKKIRKLALLGVLILKLTCYIAERSNFFCTLSGRNTLCQPITFSFWITQFSRSIQIPFSCPCVEGRKLRVSNKAVISISCSHKERFLGLNIRVILMHYSQRCVSIPSQLGSWNITCLYGGIEHYYAMQRQQRMITGSITCDCERQYFILY